MILKEVELQGFGSYRDYTKVSFPLGLVGIVGEYQSNSLRSVGSGKSTLVNSALYSLFGKGPFKKLDDLLNDKLPLDSKMFVKWVINHNFTDFRIERGRVKGNTYINVEEKSSLNSNDFIPRGDPKKPARDEEIRQILGMDYDMMTSSIFFEQRKLTKLIDTEPSERREYTEKALDLRLWTIALKNEVSSATKLKEKKQQKEEKFISLEKAITECLEEIKNKQLVENELQDLKVSLQDLVNQIQSFKEISSFKEKEKELRQTLDNLSKSYASQLKVLESQEVSLLNEQKEIENHTSKKNIVISDLAELQVVSTQENEKFISENKTLSGLKLEERTLIIEISKNTSLLDTANKKKLRLSEGTCPHCEQTITDSYITSFQASVEQEIAQIQAVLSKITTQQQEITSKIQSHETIYNNIQKKLSEISEKKVKLTSDLENLTTSLGKHTRNVKELQDSIENLSETTKILSNSIENSQSSLNELKEKIIFVSNLENMDNLILAQEEKTKRYDNLLITLGKIQKEEERISNLEEEKANLLQELVQIEEDLEVSKIIQAGFSAIPSSIFEESVKYLQTESTKIIQQFFPEMQVKVYEDTSKKNKPLEFCFIVDHKPRSFYMLSGGQKTILSLGIRIAYSKTISLRAGVHTDLLVLDEPFEFIDVYCRDLVKRVLREISTWFKQVIVISHVDNIADFPQLIKVLYTKEGTSIIV